MVRVMIKCPEKGKPVPTNMAMDKSSFESSTIEYNIVINCPICGHHHVWTKKDAFLEDEDKS